MENNTKLVKPESDKKIKMVKMKAFMRMRLLAKVINPDAKDGLETVEIAEDQIFEVPEEVALQLETPTEGLPKFSGTRPAEEAEYNQHYRAKRVD